MLKLAKTVLAFPLPLENILTKLKDFVLTFPDFIAGGENSLSLFLQRNNYGNAKDFILGMFAPTRGWFLGISLALESHLSIWYFATRRSVLILIVLIFTAQKPAKRITWLASWEWDPIGILLAPNKTVSFGRKLIYFD